MTLAHPRRFRRAALAATLGPVRATMLAAVLVWAAPALAQTPPPSAGSAPGSATGDDLLAFYRSGGAVTQPFVVLHDEFPAEWRDFTTHVLDEIRNGRSPRAYAIQYVLALVEARRSYVASAPDSALRDLARARAGLLTHLKARRVQSCAAYGEYNGLTPADSGDTEAQAGYSQVVSAQLRAIRQGMDMPTPHAGAKEADFDRLLGAFREAGGSERQWAALFEGETENLPAADQCDAWIAFYGALARGPGPSAGRMAAWMFGPDDAPTGAEALGSATVS